MRKAILICGVLAFDVLANWGQKVPFMTSDNGQYAAVFSYEQGKRSISFKRVQMECVARIATFTNFKVEVNGREIQSTMICVNDYLIIRPGAEDQHYISVQFKRKNRVMLVLNSKVVATFDAKGFAKFWSAT